MLRDDGGIEGTRFRSVWPGAALSAALIGLACAAGSADDTPPSGRVGAALTSGEPGEAVVVSAGLEATSAIRACLGDPAGYEGREELEPHAAADPRDPAHIVAAWMTRVEGERGAILASRSPDGGRTWSAPKTLPFSACGGGLEGLPSASDPWVAIGPEGRVYVSAIGWKPGVDIDSASALLVVTSTDGGESWGDPSIVSASWSPEFMHDNTAIAADPHMPGVAWIATTHWSPAGRPAAVSRTDDGGVTWSPLVFVTPAYRSAPASAPQPVISDGATHVFYGHGPDGSLVSHVRSTDGGRTWSAPFLVHEGVPIESPVRFPGSATEILVAEDIMHAAADPRTGDLYIVLTTAPRPNEARGPTVLVTASDDAGETWTRAIRLGEGGEPAWRPTLAVAPSAGAAVTWFRAAEGGAATESVGFDTELRLRWFAVSAQGTLDGGRSLVLDRFRWSARYTGSFFLGDYHGLVASDSGAVALFARSMEMGSRIVAVRSTRP